MSAEDTLDRIYVLPELYELAFSYRDYAFECDRLLAWYRDCSNSNDPPVSALELAAGPADHAIELARRGVRAAALDLNPNMCEHARSRATAAGVNVDVFAGNMIAFDVGRKFDLIFLMLSSVSHIQSSEDLVRHFQAVRRHLTPGGSYVLETTHPKDFLGRGSRTSGVAVPWTIEAGDRTLRVRWGSPNDPYDVIRQVFRCTIHLELTEHASGTKRVFEDQFEMRDYTFHELTHAAGLAGLQVALAAGGFEPGISLEHPEAWRMILVFLPTS